MRLVCSAGGTFGLKAVSQSQSETLWFALRFYRFVVRRSRVFLYVDLPAILY